MLPIIFMVTLIIGVMILQFAHWEWEGLGAITSLVSGLLLFFSLVAIPVNRMEVRGQIEEYKAVMSLVNHSGGLPESVAYKLKVAEQNQWLASSQFYGKTLLLGIYYPPELYDLKVIE